MSKIITIGVYVLIAWGVVFIALQGFGFVDWKWYWIMSPLFAAAVIYVVMIILAVILGMEIQ